MKIIEIANNVLLPITNEEAEVLAKFKTAESVLRHQLEDREIYLANQLVNKDILLRKNHDGKITYSKKIKD
jgi:hypothetical protein